MKGTVSPIAANSVIVVGLCIVTHSNIFKRLFPMRLSLSKAAVAVAVTIITIPSLFAELNNGYEPPGPSTRRSGLAISEIMFHPRENRDGDSRNLEFIEIYNSNPWPEPMGGYRIAGDVDFTFPGSAEVGSQGYLVVAANPGDIAAEYGIAGVLGPWEGALSDGGGGVRLLKQAGAVLLEIDYDDAAPWPDAADGAGHSLVLARASFGEGDVRAWSASSRIGGSPGVADAVPAGGDLENIVINELLAHGSPEVVDFVELHNRSADSVDVSGCRLTDDPAADKFEVPAATVIPGGGFLSYDEATLGFALSSGGETVYLKTPVGDRVLDAIRFGGQAVDTAFGRQPDGSAVTGELALPTPGDSNAPPLERDVVINEIMYHPLSLSGDSGGEFVELTNRGSSAIDLSGWAFRAGIDFAFPAGASIAPEGFVVVARDRTRLIADHPGLSADTVFGNFGGSLSNSGERIELAMPVTRVDGEGEGVVFVAVDEVTYRDGGRWGERADGGGSSLELVDSHADNRLAPNWEPSDESGKGAWTQVEVTDLLELGAGTADQLQLFLLGEGEAMVDDVEVVPEGGSNRVTNSAFSSDANWFFQGTHAPSSIEDGALHVRAVKRGDLGSNRIRTKLSSALSSGTRATIRARVRWLAGHPEILFRLKGNYMELFATLEVPANLGTPGEANSRAVANAVPVVYEVTHDPLVPASNETVRVTARVNDPDGILNVDLKYRLDPSTTLLRVPMKDDGTDGDLVAGDHVFSALIPGQRSRTLAAFHVVARDLSPQSGNGYFPDGVDGAPGREGLILWGDRDYPGEFGTYRIWMTRETRDAWEAREKMSNQPMDVTFVYNDQRVIYGAGSYYSGSAFTSPGYDSPIGRICGYDVIFPDDDSILGDNKLTLDFPVRDPTGQREQLMYWFCDKSGLPNNYRRYVNLFVNGIGQRSRSGWGTGSNAIYTDIQQPNSDMVKEWFPDAADGHLVKGAFWFEFDDKGARQGGVTSPTLEIFNGADGEKKLTRYRWNWRLRGVRGSANDYSEIFNRVDALNTRGDDFMPAAEATVDVDQWMRTFVVNDLAANWDSFGNPGGKNTFHYKPPDQPWQLMNWDYDVGLGVFNDPVDSPLFNVSDPVVRKFYTTQPFLRSYWHAMREAVDGFFQRSEVAPVLNAKWAALQAARVPLTSPNVASGQAGLSIPGWIDRRRQFLLEELAKVERPFAITTNDGAGFSTENFRIELQGTAPMSVHQIHLNGEPVSVEWQSVNTWVMDIALGAGAHTLIIDGRDRSGTPITEASESITVTVTGGGEDSPLGNVVINELMYYPEAPGGEFLELHNRSTTTAFDLGGWQINGLGFTFAPGTVLPADEFVVIAGNAGAFGRTYGWSVPLAGEYSGSLDNGGETLTLLQPDTAGGNEIIIDQLRYDDDAPWPVAANGLGASLQLVDPERDNTLAYNWKADIDLSDDGGDPPGVLVPMTGDWHYNQNGFVPTGWNQLGFDDTTWPSGAGLLYVESAALPAPKNTELSLGPITFFFRTKFQFSGQVGAASLALSTILDDGAVVYLNGVEIHRTRLPDGVIFPNTLATPFVDNAMLEGPLVVPAPSLVSGENVLAVEVHQSVTNSTDVVMGVELSEADAVTIAFTPGKRNSTAGVLPAVAGLWLNEIQPNRIDGIIDNAGETEPWVEIFNADAGVVPVDRWYLSDDPKQLTKWAFPSDWALESSGFGLVWLDGEPGESGPDDRHTGFSIAPGPGTLFLCFEADDGQLLVVDAMDFDGIATSASRGRFPDGSPVPQQELVRPTPGGKNDNSTDLPPVLINEWMASNNGAVADPADGDFDDWFELHNAGGEQVNLTGFTLTDDLANPGKFTIPAGITVPPNGFLLIWADEEPSQSQPGGDLHVNFKLNAEAEQIGLFTSDGLLVDAVSFLSQTAGVSEGRWPDGASSPDNENIYPQSSATPGVLNDLTPPGEARIPALIVDRLPTDSVRLLFSTEFGRYYQVQMSIGLSLEHWQDNGLPVAGFGQPIEVIDAEATDQGPAAPSRYYRIAVLRSSE
ncbi:MAG: hypothetical protein ACI9R3_003622 [Verrucomicrobiales bacterium]